MTIPLLFTLAALCALGLRVVLHVGRRSTHRHEWSLVGAGFAVVGCMAFTAACFACVFSVLPR